jgi:hypothetical protein
MRAMMFSPYFRAPIGFSEEMMRLSIAARNSLILGEVLPKTGWLIKV